MRGRGRRAGATKAVKRSLTLAWMLHWRIARPGTVGQSWQSSILSCLDQTAKQLLEITNTSSPRDRAWIKVLAGRVTLFLPRSDLTSPACAPIVILRPFQDAIVSVSSVCFGTLVAASCRNRQLPTLTYHRSYRS